MAHGLRLESCPYHPVASGRGSVQAASSLGQGSCLPLLTKSIAMCTDSVELAALINCPIPSWEKQMTAGPHTYPHCRIEDEGPV